MVSGIDLRDLFVHCIHKNIFLFHGIDPRSILIKFQATGYAIQRVWCPSQARVVPGRASGIKMVGIAGMGATISLDGMPVHPD